MSMTVFEIKEIVANIKYLDWELRVRMDGERPYLQVFGNGPNPDNNMEVEQWSGRKWFLSPHMCKNEVIRTAYKAVECAVAHEMNECFLYKGVAVMTPHLDYEEVVTMMQDHDCIDARDNGMQGV